MCIECVFKNQLILLKTLGEETFGVALPQVKIANNRHFLQFDDDEWVA